MSEIVASGKRKTAVRSKVWNYK